jgi:hypothetical protein
MSETHQTGSEPSSPTTTSPAATTNGAAAPAAAFYEAFGDKGLAADQTVQKFTSAEEMARSYVNLEKRFGVPPERRIDLPEDVTNAEAMRGVWSKLGLPEKADGYGFKLADGSTEADNAMLGKYVEKAHAVGLPTAQARQMLEWWVSENAAAQQAAVDAEKERRTNGEARLKTAFGGAYDARMREAKNIIARYDPKGETGFSEANLALFPQLTEMLIRMSDKMAEPEGGLGGETEQTERPLTPAQANAKLNELALDKAKQEALMNSQHPAHKAVLAERTKLLEAANPRPGPAR